MTTKRTDFIEEINGDILEYIDETHTYLVNGIQVPSITQILDAKFKTKYAGVRPEVLSNAAERGTKIHAAIEEYAITGLNDQELEEVRNFRFLMKQYDFIPLRTEVPVILYDKDYDIAAAGRLDMLLNEGDKLGIGDIKTTYTLDTNYLGYQLNLYRMAYEQNTGRRVHFLRGIHLREKKRVYKNIPINDEVVWEALDEWRKEHNETDK